MAGQGNIYSNQVLYKRLTASIAGGRLCHAYLFYGPRGIGKKTLAQEFARAILCQGQGERPCESCSSCHKFRSGNHPDFYCYDGKTGANAIHIELIRELRSDAYIKPNDGKYKVYLLPGAEDMTIGAANALLKVLEEPPSHTVFLLTAHNRDRVPLTIRSRCIQQELYPMAVEETALALREIGETAFRTALEEEKVSSLGDWGNALSTTKKKGKAAGTVTNSPKGKKAALDEKPAPKRHGDRELRSAAELSGGNLGLALTILNDENYAGILAISHRIAEGIRRGNEYEVLAAFCQAGQTKETVLALLSQLSALVRAALLDKLGIRKAADEAAAALAPRLTSSQMNSLSELLEEGARAVNGNVNIGALTNYLTAHMMKATSE